MTADGDYSEIADSQLDALEVGTDIDLYNAGLDTGELIFRMPGQAQSLSTAVTTKEGIRMRLPVPEHARYKVFWSTDGPDRASKPFFPTRSSPDRLHLRAGWRRSAG